MTFSYLGFLKKNSISTTIAAPGIAAGSTSAPVTETAIFTAADGSLLTKYIVLAPDGDTEIYTEEITITGRSAATGAGDITGMTRAVNADGTIGAARAWPAGTLVCVLPTIGLFNAIKANFEALMTQAAVTFYVDPAATGTGDGLSWTNACTTIAAAVALAPQIIANSITIIVRKGASDYNETVTIARTGSGSGSITIRGEYYWSGTNASSKTGKFDLAAGATGYADRAQIASGDVVWMQKWSGTVEASLPAESFEDTVASVSGTEVTLTTNTAKALDTAWTFAIVKTRITNTTAGAIVTSGPAPVALTGLYLATTAAAQIVVYATKNKVTLTTCYLLTAYRGVYAIDRSEFRGNRLYVKSTTASAQGIAGGSSLININYSVINLTGGTDYGIYSSRNCELVTAYNHIDSAVYGIYVLDGGTVEHYPTLNLNDATLPTYGIGMWQANSPTLAWTTGTPASVTTIARWTRNGRTITGNVDISSTDANGCTALTITLPVTPANNSNNIPCASLQLNDTTWSNPLAYILADGSNNKINFRNFTTVADTKAVKIQVAFQYEVA